MTTVLTANELQEYRNMPEYGLWDAVFLWHGFKPPLTPINENPPLDVLPHHGMQRLHGRLYEAMVNGELDHKPVKREDGSTRFALPYRTGLIEWCKKTGHPLPKFLEDGPAKPNGTLRCSSCDNGVEGWMAFCPFCGTQTGASHG